MRTIIILIIIVISSYSQISSTSNKTKIADTPFVRQRSIDTFKINIGSGTINVKNTDTQYIRQRSIDSFKVKITDTPYIKQRGIDTFKVGIMDTPFIKQRSIDTFKVKNTDTQFVKQRSIDTFKIKNTDTQYVRQRTVDTFKVRTVDSIIAKLSGGLQRVDTVIHIKDTVKTTSDMVQKVIVDTKNSSNTNLAVGNSYTFTGGATSTLGIVGIQVSLKTNQNCIVKVQQSPDSSNWDVTDSFSYYASINNFGVTVQAVNSYVRVIVYTASLTTGYFRLQTCLCPIVEAVPRSLDMNGYFKTATYGNYDSYGFETEYTPMGEMRVVIPTRLVGAIIDGSVIDTNFWTSSSTGTGASISCSGGEMVLTSGTDSAATVHLYSVRKARYVGGASNRYRAVIQVGSAQSKNRRRWGVVYGDTMPNFRQGAFYEMDSTSFSINTMKDNSITKVVSGSFNGKIGSSYSPGTDVVTFEIYWTNSKVYFVIGNILLHTVSASSSTWSSTKSFYVYYGSYNTNAATSTTLKTRAGTIYRLGQLETSTIYKRITSATLKVLKYGPGRLQRIVFNTFNNGAYCTLIDRGGGSAKTGDTISVTAPVNNIYPGSIWYGLDFYSGLTITTSGTLDLTIIYE